MDILVPYASMLAMAFAAGTLLPFSSEVALVAAMKATSASTTGLVAFATVGNVAGSLFNWWIGRSAARFEGQRWFPFKQPQIDSASARFQKLGLWSLVFSWLPVIGDPLTFVAGVLRVPLLVFLALVTIGRLGRYIVVATSASAVM
jgi:membrane protein YqaA with SNARE-associated domain